jgi:hypothetical protein
MPGASQQHELGVRAGPAQRVVQGLPLGDRDDVVPVAVRDQEGRRLGRDPGEQAEVRGMIGGLDHRTHAQQTRLERERQEARLDTAAGAGDEQVGLTEPMDDGLDVAGLLAVSADSAFEPAIARRQRQERAELRVSPTHPHTAESFPIDLDPSLREYHKKIATRIDSLRSAPIDGQPARPVLHP